MPEPTTQDVMDYIKGCLADAQQYIDKAAGLIDLANRSLMEQGLVGWNLADAWSACGSVRTHIDRHIEHVFGIEEPGEAYRAYRHSLMTLCNPAPQITTSSLNLKQCNRAGQHAAHRWNADQADPTQEYHCYGC